MAENDSATTTTIGDAEDETFLDLTNKPHPEGIGITFRLNPALEVRQSLRQELLSNLIHALSLFWLWINVLVSLWHHSLGSMIQELILVNNHLSSISGLEPLTKLQV
jgi:hypothetical protein